MSKVWIIILFGFCSVASAGAVAEEENASQYCARDDSLAVQF